MRGFLITFVSITFFLGAFAQYDYAIPKGSAEAIKDGYKVPAHYLASNELTWGAVESQCFDEPAKYGLWLEVSKLKSSQIKVTVLSREAKNFVVMPKFYFGKEEVIGKNKRLTEVICKSFDQKAEEYTFEVIGLNPETRYWVLVATDAPEQRFGLEVTEKFTPTPTPSVTESVKEPRNTIIGQIRTINGEAKKGVVVTLVDEHFNEISNTTSEADGTFSFEELPSDKVFLVKLDEEDTELLVDVFLQSENKSITNRARKNEDGLYSFEPQKNTFNALKLLTKTDWTMNVAEGKTGIMGRVVNAKSFLLGKKDVKVGLYDLQKKLVSSTKTDEAGRFEFRDLNNGDYMVKVENPAEEDYSEIVIVDDLNVPFFYANSSMVGADGFFKFEKLPADVVELKRLTERDTRMQLPQNDFKTLEAGKPIVLKNILFELGSGNLKSASFNELDKLAEALETKPSVKIEISGHTDNQGSEKYNQQLSQQRAEAVMKYLIAKGISANRLSAKGFGEAKPIATNDTEAGRKQNRRVEFVVVE